MTIFGKHMAILSFLRLQQHHAKLVEPHFPFLHMYIIYKPFNKHKPGKSIIHAPVNLNFLPQHKHHMNGLP